MPPKQTVAIYGGSFNPPGIHHRLIGEALCNAFDRVVVVPCGWRPDKPQTNDVEPMFRATMVDLAFKGCCSDRLKVDLFDLEQGPFTPNLKLQQKYEEEFKDTPTELWHVVGADMIEGGHSNSSPIQLAWEDGPVIWKELNWVVVTRPDYTLNAQDFDCPPKSRRLVLAQPDSSTAIRERAFSRLPYDHLVCPAVQWHIERYSLYRGTFQSLRKAHLNLPQITPWILADDRNPKAGRIAAHLKQCMKVAERPEDANILYVVGGDGFMLHTIHQYWRWRLPFFGINAGHLGFLLNDMVLPPLPGTKGDGDKEEGADGHPNAGDADTEPGQPQKRRKTDSKKADGKDTALTGVPRGRAMSSTASGPHTTWPSPKSHHGVVHMPLLFVEVEQVDGTKQSSLAFNDAWVERSSGQTAWIKIEVSGVQRLEKLVADGVLVSTAAGSPSYARAMGASPLPLNVPALVLVGSNVLTPSFFAPAVLPLDAKLVLTNLNPDKRPLRGFVDGIPHGDNVRKMTLRVSNAASVELVFDEALDLAEKLARIQFP